MTMPAEDEFTELVDADIPRVDLVDAAANGTRFLIAKREDGPTGLLDPDYVRDLIGKAGPEPEVGETVTMTGSPAAIAKLIHQAAVRRADPEQVTKAKYDADDLKRMANNGQAMRDQSYPIADREDLTRAVRAVGRGGADHNAIRRHVIARAKALGATGEIPDNWNADGSLKGAVSKEMETTVPETAEVAKDLVLDDSGDPMDPAVILAAPDGEAPGDPMDPGSPAWEAIDAATAQKWTSILARAKAAVATLSQREMLEATAGDCEDEANAWDLDDACCAIDFAIGVLAPFAISEQSEADCGADMMAAVGKALSTFDPAPLDTLEAFAQVRKAGRVLSTANEAAIRGAVESLQKVLASLPQAPTAPDDGQQVAKEEETTMADNDTQSVHTDVPATTPDATTHLGTPKDPASAEVPAARDVAKAAEETAPDVEAEPETAPVAKADKVAQVAIYDADGNLVGTVDPGDVTPLANAKAPPAAPDAKTEGDAAPSAAPAAPPADLTPAPAATVGTPADAVPDDDVTKTTGSPEPTEAVQDVFKSAIDSAIRAALDDYSAGQEQVIAKQAADLDAQAKVIKGLEDRLETVENQPVVGAVFGNGAVPPPHMLRGQNTGAPVDLTRAEQLKKQLAESGDAIVKKRIADEMQEMAIARFQEMQQQMQRR